MSELEIRPGEAFGPLRLGMTEREAVDAMAAVGVHGERQRLWDMKADPPVQYDADPVRVWFAECLRADFDAEGRLEFVELCDGSLRGMLEGVDVLATERDAAVALLARVTGEDPVIEEGGTMITFPGTTASLWRGGDPERAQGRWETVAIGPPGYYG
jgi:hypothetical protein